MSEIVGLLGVMGVLALALIILPPALMLPYHPKVRIPGVKLWWKWVDYWTDKAIQWEEQ